jgi:hypothetical protein
MAIILTTMFSDGMFGVGEAVLHRRPLTIEAAREVLAQPYRTVAFRPTDRARVDRLDDMLMTLGIRAGERIQRCSLVMGDTLILARLVHTAIGRETRPEKALRLTRFDVLPVQVFRMEDVVVGAA